MTNEKEMPARIWIDEALGMVGYVNEPPPPRSDFKYEYVRADLLATVRAEEREAAFKDAARIASDFKRLDQDTLWSMYKTLQVEIAISEAALTEKIGKGEG